MTRAPSDAARLLLAAVVCTSAALTAAPGPRALPWAALVAVLVLLAASARGRPAPQQAAAVLTGAAAVVLALLAVLDVDRAALAAALQCAVATAVLHERTGLRHAAAGPAPRQPVRWPVARPSRSAPRGRLADRVERRDRD